jgi:hypothetical protein
MQIKAVYIKPGMNLKDAQLAFFRPVVYGVARNKTKILSRK